MLRLPKLNWKTSALRSEADIQLILIKGSANDPKRTMGRTRPPGLLFMSMRSHFRAGNN